MVSWNPKFFANGENHFKPNDDTPAAPHTLAGHLTESILLFDRYLKKGYIEKLSSEEAGMLLMRIEEFQQWASALEDSSPIYDDDGVVFQGENTMEIEYLVAAGCRLSADLSEKILMHFIDLEDEAQKRMDRLNAELREVLIAKQKVSRLIGKAQSLRQHNLSIGEAAGLGVFI